MNMASITIMHEHKNLIFAAEVANQTGAEFEEDGQWITITDTPTLTIPRSCYDDAFDPNGQRQRQGDSQLESAWRSLLLNKQGFLVHFDDFEIIITDEKPKADRPQFLLRFPTQAEKGEAEKWAARAGFSSLTDYILEAVKAFNKSWSEQSR
jgi:hypothetical protein